jgi:uncharacterized protein
MLPVGDIDAMWLRDSQNQLMAYIPYAKNDADLRMLLRGAINRQAKSILIDSYANSFNYNNSGAGHQSDTRTPPMTAGVFEGKYELDSLMSFLKLSYWYYRYMGDEELRVIATSTWISAAEKVLDTVQTMQSQTGQNDSPSYLFERETTVATDTLMMDGRGPPSKPIGLSRQLFRPSDDAVTLPYNIPGNMMACQELKHLGQMLAVLRPENQSIASQVLSLSRDICLQLQAVVLQYHSQIPYEVDGYGGAVFMDDANVPSLLSIPLLGFLTASDKRYQATRSKLLSSSNPFFYSGAYGEGIGGPHVGPNYVWPMSIIVRGMTAVDEAEIESCLKMLMTTTANTGLMHESFLASNSSVYTRSWFAWANGLFGELILQLIRTNPKLVLLDDDEVIAKAQSIVQIPVSLQVQLDSSSADE